MKVPNYTYRELYYDILLATTRKERDKSIRHYRLTLLQLYRDTCWEARVGATYKELTYTQDSLYNFFQFKVKEFMIKHIEIETLDKLSQLG